MKTTILVCSCFIVTCLGVTDLRSQVNGSVKPVGTTAKITGKVVDINGVAVSGALITLSGSNGELQRSTDSSGDYSIEVGEGLYTIKAWSPGFWDSKRSTFRVRDNSAIQFDFQLIFYELARLNSAKNGTAAERICTCSIPLNTRLLRLPVPDANGIHDAIISYGGEPSPGSDDRIEFGSISIAYGPCDRVEREVNSGPLSNDRSVQVTLTFDRMTLKSDKLFYDPNTSTFTAEGSASLKNDNENKTAKTIILSFGPTGPVVKM